MTKNRRLRTSRLGATRKAAALVLATTAILVAMMAPAALASAAQRDIVLAATYSGGPDTITSFRCAPASGPSTCHGTAAGAATYAGGWSGTSHYEYRFLVGPSGTVTVEISELFEGTVAGCATGSFTVLTHETIEPTGAAHGRWVVPALGTGDLTLMTGSGTSTGNYGPDGAGTGQLAGHLNCPTNSAPRS